MATVAIKKTPPKNDANENLDALVERMIAKLKADSRKLDKNPSEAAVHRAVTRLVNDIHEIRSRTPKTVRVSIMMRIGRLIASEAYSNVLLAALAAGHVTSLASTQSTVMGVLLYVAGPKFQAITGKSWRGESVSLIVAGAIMGILGRSIKKFSKSQRKKLDEPNLPRHM